MFSTIIVFGVLMTTKVSAYQYKLGVKVKGQIYLKSD